MLVNELGGIVDLIVDHHEDVLLGVVLGNILVGVLLGSHFDGSCEGRGGSSEGFGVLREGGWHVIGEGSCRRVCCNLRRWEVLSGLIR